MRRIYLDHVGTTPAAPEVVEAMLPHFGEQFGNPSSPSERGAAALRAVSDARAAVASLLGCPAEEILFTGSATESNNLALKGIAAAAPSGSGQLVATATEHLSILHPLRTLQRSGLRVTLLPVDTFGRVDPDDLRRALAAPTLLVSIAHASAEIGTLQPIADLCRIAGEHGVPVHCDASVTGGLVPWPREGLRPDLVTLTPHLFYGPQGVAALRARSGIRLRPLIEGGTQEGGLRAGTEAVAAIAGFGAAAALAARRMRHRAGRGRELAQRLWRQLSDRLDGLTFTGHPAERVPGHVSLCVRGVEAEALLRALDEEGIEASSGSACTTGAGKPSHVLTALGIDAALARGALSLSFGDTSRDEDPERAAEIMQPVVERLRALSPPGLV